MAPRGENRSIGAEIARLMWTTSAGFVQPRLRRPANARHPSQSSPGRDIRNHSGEIMLDRGESFIATRNGIPVGELPATPASIVST
jgi:hypothetical protein